MTPLRSAAVIGMGALGMLFGGLLRDAPNLDFSFVMDNTRYEKYRDMTFTRNGQPASYPMTPVSRAKPVDFLLVAVKYPALASAMDTAAAVVGPDTVIISVMNGISSERLLAERFGADRVLETVAQGMDAMHFGTSLQYTRTGTLCVGLSAGASQQKAENYRRLLDLFDRAAIPYTVEDDILHRLWGKFMLNVGINQVCMVYGTDYGHATAPDSDCRAVLFGAMREVILCANAEGIALGEDDITYYDKILHTLAPDATPSMGQDRLNRRPSEVDAFAGEVRRLAAKHGIPVPANDFLFRRVHEIEKEYIY